MPRNVALPARNVKKRGTREGDRPTFAARKPRQPDAWVSYLDPPCTCHQLYDTGLLGVWAGADDDVVVRRIAILVVAVVVLGDFEDEGEPGDPPEVTRTVWSGPPFYAQDGGGSVACKSCMAGLRKDDGAEFMRSENGAYLAVVDNLSGCEICDAVAVVLQM